MVRDFFRWLCWWQPPCLLSTVIVNQVSDPNTAIRGVLFRSRGPWLVLKQAEALTAGEKPTAIDGEVVIHRAQVSFMQKLT
jgi:hypothetical protein